MTSTEESIDFLSINRKIIISPSIPLQILDLYCRNQERVQATILGKIYSNSIEVLEVVPDGLCKSNKEIKAINFEEPQQANNYQRSLENIMAVYPTLQILGVCVTDLNVDINLAKLHTIYSHKESGFKPEGILMYPLILSIGTKLIEKSQQSDLSQQNDTSLLYGKQSQKQFDIAAYNYNQTLRFCKEVMEATPFEKLDAEISFGSDANIETHTALFEALNDNQERWVPQNTVFAPSGSEGEKVGTIQSQKEMIQNLQKNLLALKQKTDTNGYDKLNKKLKAIIDALNEAEEYSMEDLGYLLDLAGLYRKMALKINKFL